MTRLRAQLAMELWILRPYARQYSLLLAIGLLYCLFLDTGTPVLLTMVLLTGSYAFSITETHQLEMLFASLPTARAAVVWARYAVTAIALIAMGMIGLTLPFVRALAGLAHFWWPDGDLAVLAFSFPMAALLIAIQFPFLFKLGYNRARPITMISLFVVVAALAGTLFLLSDNEVSARHLLVSVVDKNPPVALLSSLLIGLVTLAVSAAISARLYARKDL